jgi:hypothetical protein
MTFTNPGDCPGFFFLTTSSEKIRQKKLTVGVKITQLTQRHLSKIGERPMKALF